MHFLRSLLPLLLCLCFADRAGAVSCDTLAADTLAPVAAPSCCDFRLRPRDIVIPAAVVSFSAFTARNGWLRKKRDVIQDALSPRRGGIHTTVDDYIQYVPSATVLALNAFYDRQGTRRFVDRMGVHLVAFATMTALTQGLKYTIRERRPDSGARNSFPSGHTATAFMGAELLRIEYAGISPWIGYAGYAVAATTAFLRVYNNRHYLNDVLAGAAIGIFSSRFATWLYPRAFRRSACRPASAPAISCIPFAGPAGYGASFSISL